MLYLGIDLHRKQMTVSLRNPNGDVLLRRLIRLAHVTQPGVHLPEMGLDLILVVAAHFLREGRMRLVFVKEGAELSIDVGLHVA